MPAELKLEKIERNRNMFKYSMRVLSPVAKNLPLLSNNNEAAHFMVNHKIEDFSRSRVPQSHLKMKQVFSFDPKVIKDNFVSKHQVKR